MAVTMVFAFSLIFYAKLFKFSLIRQNSKSLQIPEIKPRNYFQRMEPEKPKTKWGSWICAAINCHSHYCIDRVTIFQFSWEKER